MEFEALITLAAVIFREQRLTSTTPLPHLHCSDGSQKNDDPL